MLIRLRNTAFLATAIVGWRELQGGDFYLNLIGGGTVFFKSLTDEERTALNWTLNVCFNQQLNALEFYRNRDSLQPPRPASAVSEVDENNEQYVGLPSEAEMDQMAATMAPATPPPVPVLPDPYAAPELDLSHVTVHNELRKLLKREPTKEEMAIAMEKLKAFQVMEGGRKP